jgi:hypothetical protein
MRPGTCIHFTGIMEPCCKAGVNYDQLAGGPEFGRWLRLPCVSGKDNKGVTPKACSKRLEPTPEQIAQSEAEWKAAQDRFRKVMPVVAEWRNKGAKGKYEVIECPACGGKLHLQQSHYNGHVHGKCETDGCVSWME